MENYIKILYKKFLYGTISKDEFLEMRHDLNQADSDNIKHLLEDEWKENLETEVMDEKDKQEILTKLNFYVEYDGKRILRKRIIQVAAVIIPFVLIFSALLLTNRAIPKVEKDFVVVVKQGNRAQVTLPDQSKVWMNSNSKLIYKTGRNNAREVKLTGEAFFKVYKDKNRPFIITAQNIQVEVIGTSFNLKARPGSDLIETSLVEGSIKLSGTELSQDYILKPNEKAVYSNSTNSMRIEFTDNEVETAWKDNKLQFRSERFADVIKKLEEWYGVKIIFDCPEIANDLLSGTFRGESLSTVLESFRIQYNIRYTLQGDTIVTIQKK